MYGDLLDIVEKISNVSFMLGVKVNGRSLCSDYALEESEKIRRLPRYCDVLNERYNV